MEVEKIKDKIQQAQNAKNLLSGAFLDQEVSKRSMTFREFYHANNNSDSDSSMSDLSDDEFDEDGAPWSKGQTKK